MPIFSVFLYYYEIDYLDWPNWKYAAMMTAVYIDMIIAVVIYNIFLQNLSLRKISLFTFISEAFVSAFLTLFVAGVFFGMNPLTFAALFGEPLLVIHYAF